MDRRTSPSRVCAQLDSNGVSRSDTMTDQYEVPHDGVTARRMILSSQVSGCRQPSNSCRHTLARDEGRIPSFSDAPPTDKPPVRDSCSSCDHRPVGRVRMISNSSCSFTRHDTDAVLPDSSKTSIPRDRQNSQIAVETHWQTGNLHRVHRELEMCRISSSVDIQGALAAKRTNESNPLRNERYIRENTETVQSSGDDELSTFPESRNRSCRFVTCEHPDVEFMRPFYDGDYVNKRMAEIRQYIDMIRRKWDQYDTFNEMLTGLMEDKIAEFTDDDPDVVAHMKSLFSIKKEWKQHESEIEDSFDSIRLYTSQIGYCSFFSVINGLFRKDDTTQCENVITAAVFLVELLNIDLFNYCLKYPSLNNFQGQVYRGIVLSDEDFKQFQAVAERPFEDRYISVPLGLVSTSLDQCQAERFLSMQADKAPHLMLMKIHVIELNPYHLAFYRKKFPSSVVTGICAVDIHQISYFSNEKEVLLRGPFFQVLQLYKDVEWSGKQNHVLEMVMLNANRDHVTSVSMAEDEDAAARKLFAVMVKVTRFRFCLDYCRLQGLIEDEAAYARLLEENSLLLKSLMGE